MSSKVTQEENQETQTSDTIPPVDTAVAEPEVAADVEVADADEISPEQALQQAQATIKDYWDQIMRLGADIENNRKRAARDIENAHKYSIKSFADALLPILDSMEMGISAAQAENASLESIREGSELTMNMFVQVLEKQGLVQIDPMGEQFDPEQHQAISMLEHESAESNTIITVMQKGFTLHDRLLRPAMVVVAK